MSSKKNTAPAPAAPASVGGKVKLRIPRGESVYVGVNGVGYLIPPMQEVEVPPEVAAEYHRAERAADRFYETSSALAQK